MSYVLKENNAFYGSKGNRISSQLYDRLPSQHQLLFEKYDSNNSEYSDLVAKIKRAANDFNDHIPVPNEVNVRNVDDFENVFNKEFVVPF